MNKEVMNELRFWGVENMHLETACDAIFRILNNHYDCDTLQGYLYYNGYLQTPDNKESNDN